MNSRETALGILLKLDRDNAYVNKALAYGLKNKTFSDIDKGFITEIVMGCVKNRELLDFYIMQFSKVKIRKMSLYVRNILEIGTYQIMFLDKVPDSAACNESVKLAKKYAVRSSGFINGVLRNLSRNKADIKQPDKNADKLEYLSVRYSYPMWLTEMLVEQYGFETCELIYEAANKSYSPMIRANRLKPDCCINGEFDKETFIEILKKDGLEIISDTEIDECFHVKSKLDINCSRAYRDGYFTLQNRSSQLAVIALNPNPGEFIIDMCAAPGGKTTAAAEQMNNSGRIVAFDIHEHKIKLIEKTAKRLGIDIIETEVRDASVFDEKYSAAADRVFVDAPCSGFGVLHTKPDIKRHRRPEDIDDLAGIQSRILDTASRYLKPGGTMVYSTCTILKQENEEQIKKFLDAHSDFELEYEKTLFTHIQGGSGFYIAKLHRN